MTIAFIPVRGGSKSIPLKNIKHFCGKPLVYWTVKALENCCNVDKVVVATDSLEIKNTVKQFGFQKVEIYDRDQQNAQDSSSTESVMLEYISKANLQEDDVFTSSVPDFMRYALNSFATLSPNTGASSSAV